MSSAVRATASRTLALTTAGILALATTATANPATIDEIIELNLRAWGGEPELLSESYAPDGVHTATFYDRTNEYVGPEEIDRVAGNGYIELIGPLVEIPAAEGELRWASFSSLGGGTACLNRAVDGRIVRHDCVLPETSTQTRAWVGLADAEASAAIDAVVERLRAAWQAGTTVERLAEVYAPDAVHSARYLDRTKVYEGPEAIRRVIMSDRPETLGRVDFEAPEGELAWAEVSDVAGGSVCLFRAVDGMITRHDCVLPIAG
jgi:hypothetical protein